MLTGCNNFAPDISQTTADEKLSKISLKENASYTLQITTYGNGTSIAGEELDEVSFKENFAVSENMVFYETYNGHWKLKKDEYSEPIMTVKKINENTIIIQKTNEEKEIELEFNSTYQIPSDFVVYDGLNYTYTICFSQN